MNHRATKAQTQRKLRQPQWRRCCPAAARYVRERLCDGLAVEGYSRVMQPISTHDHPLGPRVLRTATRAASPA